MIKNLVLYWFIFGIVVLGFLGILKARSTSNYSDDKLKTMLVGASVFRDKTDDVCKYQTPGDPTEPDKLAVKIEFFCRDGRMSVNTLSMSVFENKTVMDVIEEIGRVNGFEAQIIETWRCEIDGIPTAMDRQIQDGNLIKCRE